MSLQNRGGMVPVGERGAALCSLNYSPNISFSRLCFTQASVPAPIRGFPQTLYSWSCSTEQSPTKPQRKKKKKHISQVQGGQTLTYVPHIRTGYRYERINLRNLSFHVRSAYVYALVWHMSHFSYNLWVTRGIRPILIELDIYFLLLKAQSLPKKKQESVENFYLYQIEQKGTFPPGISPPFFYSYSPLLSRSG